MKKFFVFLILTMFLGAWAARAPQGYAQGVQTPTPAPIVNSVVQDVVSFSTLNYPDIVMRGPFDSATVQFATPSSWILQDGATLRLEINASFSSQNLSAQSSPASLTIFLNDELIKTAFIDLTGSQTIDIVIPASALKSARSDGRQVLDFGLDASLDCRFPQETMVVIRSNSTIYLPHVAAVPQTDLALLPKPIFQRYAFQPEPAVLVVPTNPTADELKAAMSVAAGFGRMSSGELVLPLVPLNLLTDAQKLNSHLVFVGKASSLQSLNAVRFPIEVLPQGLISAGSQPDDGFVQMGISPWNTARVVLYAGGNTDAGVVKAAQAVSTGLLQPSTKSNLAIISQVDAAVKVPPELEDRTLASLGYATRTVTGYGYSTLDYNFYISPGQIAGEGAYFNLVYTHSALLAFDQSSLVVSLNDQRIGSERFTEETAKQTNTLKINLPSDAMRSGNNRLSIQVELVPVNFCSETINNTLWLTVSNTSMVHLPLIPADIGIPSSMLSLNQYHIAFLNSPTLDTLAFVLPPSEPNSWSIAAVLAADLGRRSAGYVLSPEVVFPDAVEDIFLQNHNLILIGRASQLPLVAAMASSMPVPFDPNSDQASERNMAVTYRLEPNASIGYIELFTSPYGNKYTVMTVLGSTEEGLVWSGNAFAISTLRSKLAGNYAVINREQILTTDTRIGLATNLSATAVPGALPTIILPATNTIISRPAWIFPSIIVFSALIVGLLIFVAVSARNQNNPPKR
jgi:hypothetical protein